MTNFTPGVRMFRRPAAIVSLAVLGFAVAPAAHADHTPRHTNETARQTACANWAEITAGSDATSAYDPGPTAPTSDDTCTVTQRTTSVDEDRSRVNNENAAKPVHKVDRTTVTNDEATQYGWVAGSGWRDVQNTDTTEVERSEEKCVDNPSGEHCRDA